MIKIFNSIIFILLTNSAIANESKIFKCNVTKILNPTYFEESLDNNENSEISMIEDGQDIDFLIGSNLLSTKDGDVFEANPTLDFDLSFVLHPRNQLEKYLVNLLGYKGNGKLLGQTRRSKNENFNEKWEPIAELKCKNNLIK